MPTVLTPSRQVTCTINGQPVHAISVEIETESIDVTSTTNVEPDPKWEFVDAAGHFHAYATDSKTPTLERVGDEYWCDDCHENHTDYTTRCALCGEEVKPRTIDRAAFAKSIPGSTTWTMRVVSDRPLPPDRVSVHLIDENRDLFGVMHVGPWRANSPGPVETELMGFLHRRQKSD